MARTTLKKSRAGVSEMPPAGVVAEFEAALDAEVEAWLAAATARLIEQNPADEGRGPAFTRIAKRAQSTGEMRRPLRVFATATSTAKGGHLITRTLIVFPDPLAEILSGRKTWEVRTKRTQTGRRVGLSEKGAALIRGSCLLHKIHGPLSFTQVLRHARKMGTTRAEILAEPKWWKDKSARGTLFAWELKAVRTFGNPVRFKTPPGAQTWAVLPAGISKRIR